MNDTIKKLPVTKDRNGNNLRGFVKLADIPNRDTTLIMQRYLLTQIETTITRDEACVLVQAILEHFTMPAPTTIPHGHGPVGGFHALLDEARAQDHTNIALSRGHANLIADHIRLLEEQLGVFQNMKTIYQVEGTVEKNAAGDVTRLEWVDVSEDVAKTAWNEYGLLVRTVLQKSPSETPITEPKTIGQEDLPECKKRLADCPDCLVTEEEKSQPPALKDSEGLGSVVDKLRHVALITGKRDAKSISAEELLHQWPDVVSRLRDMEVADDVYQPLRKLLGYVEDGSDKVVKIFQDDATRNWWVKVGWAKECYGTTLIEAFRKHFTGDEKDGTD